MSECYVCGQTIDQANQTEEHLFINAIGGHITSKDLICKKCNRDFGEDIDTALANQFNKIATLLNIKRDRGTPQPFKAFDTENNTGYIIKPDGKILLQKPDIKQNGNHYTIKVNDEKQAHQVVHGFKRKYPELDENKILQDCHTKKEYIDNLLAIDFTLGGDETFRSLCKAAINFYLYQGGNRENICHLIPYIKGEMKTHDIVFPFYLNKPPIPTKDEEILHSIVIQGNPVEKLLFAYIELFDFYKVIVILNDNYEDKSIEYNYFFDILSRKKVSCECKFRIKRSDIQSTLKRAKPYEEMCKQLRHYLGAVVEKALKKQTKEHIGTLLNIAIDNFRNKTEGKKITESEMRDILINETMKQLTPWILHNFVETERG